MELRSVGRCGRAAGAPKSRFPQVPIAQAKERDDDQALAGHSGSLEVVGDDDDFGSDDLGSIEAHGLVVEQPGGVLRQVVVA